MINGFYLPLLERIETVEDLLVELEHLKETYLRLKEKYNIKIWTKSVVYGLREVKNFRRFVLDGLTRKGFILEGEFPPINGVIYTRIFYSFRLLQKRINPLINKRRNYEEYCKRLLS